MRGNEMDIILSVKQLFQKDKLLTKKNFFILLLLIDLYITLHTVLKASSFSFMITDDFYDAVLVRDMFEGGLLYRTLKVVQYRYMTHTGAFTCFFTLYFRLGLIANNEALLPVFIIMDILLMCVGLGIFINSLCNYIGMRNSTAKLCLFSGIIIPWFAYYSYNQVFFWFTSCNAYCNGLGILLLTLAAFLRLAYKPDTKFLVISCIAAAICGGIYIIFTPIMVLFVVIINLAELVKRKKLHYKLLISSVLLAISTLINVIAPGYRLRDEDEVQISLSDAFNHAMNGTFHDEIPKIFDNPIFIIFCIVAVYCGIRYTTTLSMNGIKFLCGVVLTIAMVILSSLPVFMGYAYDNFEMIPNRCIFTIDFTAYAAILLLFLSLGIYLKQWSGISVSRNLNAMIILLLTYIIITHFSGIFLDNARYNIIDQTNHNNINYYRGRVFEIMDIMRNSPESDVVVPFPPEAPPAINNFEIANDPTVWINEAMAAYYHKNSITAQ